MQKKKHLLVNDFNVDEFNLLALQVKIRIRRTGSHSDLQIFPYLPKNVFPTPKWVEKSDLMAEEWVRVARYRKQKKPNLAISNTFEKDQLQNGQTISFLANSFKKAKFNWFGLLKGEMATLEMSDGCWMCYCRKGPFKYMWHF